jgi:putative ABC transport system substrate-binding protein
MKRRDFITLLGGAAAWPFAARAQQGAPPVMGMLGAMGELQRSTSPIPAFSKGLEEAGFVEGRNLIIEYLGAEGHYDRLPTLAADLVRRPVNVIVALSGPAALSAKAATSTIPIVFLVGGDPVEQGLVATLNRPGGNVTGVTMLNRELLPKRLEVLHELLPSARTIAVLFNPTNPIAGIQSREAEAAARTLGVQLHILHASSEGDFDAAFARMAQLKADGLVIAPDALFVRHKEQLAALTLRDAVPAIYAYREFVEAGGLMSYGDSQAEAGHQVGLYTGRILKGEKPADLPVQQITKIELIINLKTAKALGLTFPITLLGRADEAIE